MIDLMRDNWGNIQEAYKAQTEAEKRKMKEHFNNEIAELGNNLFGDFANPEDLQRFCESLDEEAQAKLVSLCNETFELENQGQ